MSALPNQRPGVIERYGLSPEDAGRSVWAIEPGGRKLQGPAAASRVLREMGGGWRVLGWAAALPGAGLGYAIVARTRDRLSAVWGDPPPYPS